MRNLITLPLLALSLTVNFNANAGVYDMCKEEVEMENLTSLGGGNCRIKFSPGYKSSDCVGKNFDWEIFCRDSGKANEGTVCCNEQR